MMSRIIDLSHIIEAGMTTYPGLPGPVISDHLSREASRGNYSVGTTFQIGRVELVANTGTYVDTPFHRYVDGSDLASTPLERFVDLEGMVVDVRNRVTRAISEEVFSDQDVGGKAVLIRTGWDVNWRTPQYGSGHPFLTLEAAQLVVARGATLVGIDSLNIDDTADGTRPAHTVFLGAGIPIVEHLRGLENLPLTGFRFHSAPIGFRGVGSFPVRAYAILC